MIIKMNTFLIFLLNFLYVFRSISVTLKIEKIIYLISILLIIINLLLILASLNKRKISFISIFIFVGVIILTYSILLNPPIVGIVGFGVLYINLLLWYSFITLISKDKLCIFFSKFIKINIYFACITAILGIYQYFIDPSIMGLALHEIYGSSDLMASGRYVRRATGFMGSPQNYSLYIAIMTCFMPMLKTKKKWKNLILIILLLGGILSGSRAYVLFVFQTFMLTIILNGNIGIKGSKKSIKNFLLIVGVLLIAILIFNTEFKNTTFSRMISFINDWPALQIYINHLRTVNLTTVWFGNGMGVNDRVVVQLMGNKYYEVFGSYTNSYESYILSLFMQSGIVGLLAFLSIYIKSLKNSFKLKSKLYFSILVAIFINLLFTPSFNGLAMSYIIWPLILFPYYLNKESLYNPKKQLYLDGQRFHTKNMDLPIK